MYTFSDLVFEPISENSHIQKASLTFKNGYGCNIYKYSPYTNEGNPYEFELTMNGIKTFNNNISDDNIGYCTEEDIEDLIKIAQKLWNS